MNTKEFIDLVKLYCELIDMERIDLRVIETVVQVIMSYVPVNVEVKLNEIR